MTPSVRRLALTAHVTFSVGWLGAVASFLVLAIVGLTSGDAETGRAVYPALDLLTWLVIVPCSIASLATGLVQSLGTEWGLFRHYWVASKFGMNLVATVLLLIHTKPIGLVAAAATGSTWSADELHGVRVQLIADAGAALILLIAATALSVYKPRGLTPFGARRLQSGHGVASARQSGSLLNGYVLSIIVLILLFGLFHLLTGTMAPR